MCIGIPMKVLQQDDFSALCEGRGRRERVDTLLLGPQPVGGWILNFLGSARQALSEEEARQVDSALDALEAVMNGQQSVDVDAHFADIIEARHAEAL